MEIDSENWHTSYFEIFEKVGKVENFLIYQKIFLNRKYSNSSTFLRKFRDFPKWKIVHLLHSGWNFAHFYNFGKALLFLSGDKFSQNLMNMSGQCTTLRGPPWCLNFSQTYEKKTFDVTSKPWNIFPRHIHWTYLGKYPYCLFRRKNENLDRDHETWQKNKLKPLRHHDGSEGGSGDLSGVRSAVPES